MEFTHIDSRGNALMVDVGNKEITRRTAVAEGYIKMSPGCFDMVSEGRGKKGDVLGVAQIAGIMAAKRTSDIIPLCHPLMLSKVTVELELIPETCQVRAVCTACCEGKTGVEMEALTGASAALLTVYDMCKAVDRAMEIGPIRLLEKHGGKSGDFYSGAAK